MDKLPHQAGGARLVFAVQLTSPTAALADHECATTAWADTGYGTTTALCLILCNLGIDHIGLIHADGVPRSQSQPCEVVQVVEIQEHIAAAQCELEKIWTEHIEKLRATNRHNIKLGYSATLAIPKVVVEQITGYLNATCEDEYQDEDRTIIYTVQFLDGRQMDIKCCGCQNESSWTEAVLFDANGNQLCYTEPDEEFLGTWTLDYDGIDYTVQVVGEK